MRVLQDLILADSPVSGQLGDLVLMVAYETFRAESGSLLIKK